MLPLVMVLVLAGAPKADPKLAGRWLLEGEPFATLKADGTGVLEEDAVRWGVEKGELVLTADGETERVSYTLSGDTLTLHMGVPLTLTRAGKAGKGAGKTVQASAPEPREEEDVEFAVGEAPPSAPAKKQPAGKDALSQLLLSSAWCSFSYNKVSGATSQSRVRFLPDGSWSSGRQAETYNSGAYGSVAGQYNSGSGGQWAVKNGRLFMSNPPEEPSLQPVEPFEVTRNSNGSPIIKAQGTEYSSCN
jgi:hypothetical protein